MSCVVVGCDFARVSCILANEVPDDDFTECCSKEIGSTINFVLVKCSAVLAIVCAVVAMMVVMLQSSLSQFR